MKLELKYLAPYLPYSLKVVMEGKKTNVAWMSTKNIAVIIPDGIGEYKKIAWKHAVFNIKPILRPISDFCGQRIAKESMSDLSCDYEVVEEIWKLEESNNIDSISYGTINILFKNHVDVFGLIEKGLAIDINTLNNNK